MDSSKFPVARRTRLGCDRILYEHFLKERVKRARTSGAGAPVPEYEECLDLDEEEEKDEGFIGVKGDEDFDVQKSQDDSLSNGDGSDIVVVSVIDKGEGREIERSVDHEEVVVVAEDLDSLSDEKSDSDLVVESIIDKGEGNEDERMVDEEDEEEGEDVAVDEDEFDLPSSEDDSFYSEGSDETYTELKLSKSDHDESLDDLCSFDKSEDEGEDDFEDDDEVKSRRVWKKKDVKCKEKVKLKGKWRIAEGGQRGNKNDKRKYEHVVKDEGEDDFDDDEVKGRVWEKKDVQGKGKGKWWIAEGGQRGNKNDKRKHEHAEYRVKGKVDPFKFEELDSWDDMSSVKYGKSFCYVDVGNSKNGRNVGKKNEERTVKSGLKKRTESRDVADHLHSRSSFREKVN